MNDRKSEILAKNNYTVEDLRTIVSILRAPGGCPWDREQTHASIRRDLIEETYEVIEGIDKGDDAIMEEELGDLLLQVVFHADIAESDGKYDLDRVADGICRKLILRHPHVFGDVVAETSEQVLSNWDKIKIAEKSQKSDREVLDAVSHALPSLIRADKIIKKSKKMGYAVPDCTDIVAAAEASGDAAAYMSELLLRVSHAARTLGVDAEKLLSDACDTLVAAADPDKVTG